MMMIIVYIDYLLDAFWSISVLTNVRDIVADCFWWKKNKSLRNVENNDVKEYWRWYDNINDQIEVEK